MKRKAALALEAKLHERLSVLNAPGARDSVDAMFEARGKLKNPPIAGANIGEEELQQLLGVDMSGDDNREPWEALGRNDKESARLRQLLLEGAASPLVAEHDSVFQQLRRRLRQRAKHPKQTPRKKRKIHASRVEVGVVLEDEAKATRA